MLKTKRSSCFGLLLVFILTVIFCTNFVFADDNDIIDEVYIAIPVSCTMSGTGMNTHNAEIVNGLYRADIGTTTIHAFCNDIAGFALYATGYSNNEIGTQNSNKLIGSPSSIGNIATGLATSAGNPDVSNWAMKLAITQDSGNITGNNTVTIDNGFSSYHLVPSEYLKVAHKDVATDMTPSTGGVKITTTYAAYISSTQPAGTYTGQVKYTLVHPSTTPTPNSTMLDTGQVVSAKMKSLAAGTEKAYNAKTSDIKAIRMASSLPNNFVATEANTVSTDASRHPIYIFFDNTNDAGIMYFYSGDYQVVMNPDSSHLFRSNLALADISGLSTWDSSKVTTMRGMLLDSLISLNNVDALSRWDTSNVENMSFTFAMNKSTDEAGYVSIINSLSGLSNWDVSNVKDMSYMFQNAKQLSSLHGLEFWDVSSVEDMKYMFVNNYSLTSLRALASWDVSSVENMNTMFGSTYSLASLQGLEQWDVSSVTDMHYIFGMGPGQSRYNNVIMDLTHLSLWDVSNVEDMSCLFQNNNIASFIPLSNWEVGKVKDFSNAFNQTSSTTIKTLDGLENWDVSSAENMSGMFSGTPSLTDASAINGWDIRGVVLGTGDESITEGFNEMFSGTPTRPTFTLRPGTWNSNGTFIPSS